jgi:hypothetical protein
MSAARRPKAGRKLEPPRGSQSGRRAVKWVNATSEVWQRTVDRWRWNSLGSGDWEKTGSCPRCREHMRVRKGSSAFPDFVSAEALTLDELIVLEKGDRHAANDAGFYARCTCKGDHPGRPEDLKHGCGSWAMITAPPE